MIHVKSNPSSIPNHISDERRGNIHHDIRTAMMIALLSETNVTADKDSSVEDNSIESSDVLQRCATTILEVDVRTHICSLIVYNLLLMSLLQT